VIEVLKSRFAYFMETGDDSKIAADLVDIVYVMVCHCFGDSFFGVCVLMAVRDMQAVKHGGRKEYDAVRAIYEKSKTPTSRTAAMYVIATRILSGLCVDSLNVQTGHVRQPGCGPASRDIRILADKRTRPRRDLLFCWDAG
jgi:hypothetical protein